MGPFQLQYAWEWRLLGTRIGLNGCLHSRDTNCGLVTRPRYGPGWLENRRPTSVMPCIYSCYCLKIGFHESGPLRRPNVIFANCCGPGSNSSVCELRCGISCMRWPWEKASAERRSCGYQLVESNWKR